MSTLYDVISLMWNLDSHYQVNFFFFIEFILNKKNEGSLQYGYFDHFENISYKNSNKTENLKKKIIGILLDI